MKKFFNCVFVFALIFVLCGCARETIVAFVRDGTSAGSDNYTININFVEDSEFEEKSIDVLIKSNTDNLSLTFKREFDEDTELFIENKDEWYSLTNLINTYSSSIQEDYMPYIERSNMTLVIKSSQEAILKIKVVCGDETTNSQEQIILVNQVDVSKEFSLDLGKNHN